MSSSTPTLYHFVLTLQRPIRMGGMGGGFELRTWSRTVSVPAGRGRHATYNDIRESITQEQPQWADADVLHWSLEPDSLAAPVAPWAPYVPPTQDPTGTPEARGRLPHQRG
ncbi:hypothetical protein ACFRFJ_30005 [Streptomyces hydrogenans]|uniref:hypothetical protein n=1 Tax=Streptomyces hydrogenans TaxID=1873719 RepID=UPI0036CD0EA4